MTTAELTVTMPDHRWIAAVSRSYPEATFRAVAAIPGDHDGDALVRILGSNLDEILERMGNHPQVTHLGRSHTGEHEVTVQFETTHPLLLFSARASGIPPVMPVDIQDGNASVRVTGSRSRLSELGAQLRQHGLEFDLESVREELPTEQALSDRQREVLLTAVELGYSDSPARRRWLMSQMRWRSPSPPAANAPAGRRAVIKRFIEQLPDQGRMVDTSGLPSRVHEHDTAQKAVLPIPLSEPVDNSSVI